MHEEQVLSAAWTITENWKQSVIVENRTGASGNYLIGASTTASSITKANAATAAFGVRR